MNMNKERLHHMNWKRVCLSLAFIVATCSYAELAEAKSEYEVIHTGIQGGGCWYDDTHFVVVRGEQAAPGQDFEVEGLYYLDPNKPKDLRRIDLSPIDPDIQRAIRDVSCQEQTILFHILTADRKRNQLYTLNLGQPPKLLAEKTQGFIVPQSVSIRNQQVLDYATIRQGNALPGAVLSEQPKAECRFAYLRLGYRVACLPYEQETKRTWLLNNGFLAKYLWDETIRVSKNGRYEWVANPEPALKLPDGTELKQGYFLRDLDGRIVQQIPTEQDLYQVIDLSFKPDQIGKYLYGVCFKAGDHGDRHLTVGGRICRFLLDGKNRDWQEVVIIQQAPNDPFSLHDLHVNAQGDAVMIERGHRLVTSLWMYIAQTKKADKLMQISFPDELGAIQVSSNGQWVSVMKQSELVFIERKGVRP